MNNSNVLLFRSLFKFQIKCIFPDSSIHNSPQSIPALLAFKNSVMAPFTPPKRSIYIVRNREFVTFAYHSHTKALSISPCISPSKMAQSVILFSRVRPSWAPSRSALFTSQLDILYLANRCVLYPLREKRYWSPGSRDAIPFYDSAVIKMLMKLISAELSVRFASGALFSKRTISPSSVKHRTGKSLKRSIRYHLYPRSTMGQFRRFGSGRSLLVSAIA